MSDVYQRDLQMPPVIGGAGAPYSSPPDQKDLTLPPVEGTGGSGAGVGSPPEMRPLELPPTVK